MSAPALKTDVFIHERNTIFILDFKEEIVLNLPF